MDRVQVFTWAYDDLDRLIGEVFDANADGPGAGDYTDVYRYDRSSNRYDKTRDVGSDGVVDETTAYGVDANDRVQSETTDHHTDDTQDRHTAYAYGANATLGRTGQTEHAGLDATAHVLEVHAFWYDLDGRMDVVRVVKYDGQQAITSDVTTTYQYNDAGFRVSASEEDHLSGGGGGGGVVTTVYHTAPLNPTGLAQVLEEGEESPSDGDYKLDAGEIASGGRTYTLGLDVIAQQGVDTLAGGLLVLAYDGHGSTRASASPPERRARR